ncbi:hypothetical protein SAMN04487917_101328 [Arthrobacter sp. yr096]|uniref:hypothetical protein n=1 Tax=Arthrobacter sp. yr096 TaxID=1761750 RepID=UPI0008C775F1|nr:hypothetical protein [Arthrobacter sp. yr096]SEI44503.1 hypothetical protein SAMN04487917_101328 [Arthrobacter sp. yr096]
MTETHVLITALAAALSIISPVAIAFYKNDGWRKITKVSVPIVVAVAIAAAYLWVKGQTQLVTPEDWLNAFLTFYAIQQLAYTTVLRWIAEQVEKAGVQAKSSTVPGEVVDSDEPQHRA